MQADPRIMRLNLKKIQEGIDIKTTSLKSVKKKLRMVTKENETKQAELQELKKRYAETLLKLQIGTEEAQLLSKEVEEPKEPQRCNCEPAAKCSAQYNKTICRRSAR